MITLNEKIKGLYKKLLAEKDKGERHRIIKSVTELILSDPKAPCNNRDLKSMAGEVWKQAIGYEGSYEVSNLGRIKSLGCINHEESIKAQRSPKNGYPLVSIWKGNFEKKVLVHRMVALAFLSNPHNKKTVNHKFGCKVDNRAISLEWQTMGENSSHSFATLGRVSAFKGRSGKLSYVSRPVNKLNILGELIEQYETVTAAAKSVDMATTTISRVCRGQQKTASGFKWQYA